ncbi:hypothetical protein Trco_008539 [Trichoderma cornu-damae]|uniref:Zn(2)-C6 fungal-type domain-containing protein n=1 Tax=Trichoderma cornu-damae TaxID=654480 RepID=A0A9P8QIR8_9HYPO|nr:hypothetical protein Trco_008539 [Trichoderma cornu-damae]
MTSCNANRAERRKLRRGTTSCWECKRRKTRCYFKQSSPIACVPCKRRGCNCLLQHVDERHLEPETADDPVCNRDIGRQMDHLERSDLSSAITIITTVTPVSKTNADAGGARPDQWFTAAQLNELMMMFVRVFLGPSADTLRPDAQPRPSSPELSTRADSRPIDLARSLFQLAICLQKSERTSEASPLYLNRSDSDVAGRYFEAASRHVTSQDSLVVSFEGIEALMLEGLYRVCTG